MKKQIDPWDEISRLIALEKKTALDDFRRREFVPGSLPEIRTAPVPDSRPVMRRTVLALAASIFVVAGLASLWLWRGSWGRISSAPALAALLSDSFLYSQDGNNAVGAPATVRAQAPSPAFSAWVEAGLGGTPVEAEPVDPQVPVERGDPVEVRRKLSRVIRENALERLLTQFREIHNQEA